ncbi:MAG TPA: hypothetical protein DCZ95_15785 [Verrucomicrobia bacterium]|nr:MAG: hypothetical protein A2X46_07555 [Lentisphaerae bacterium GWF2_57_35]HBA85545.1 hypothetical protein [Verrucomicrobiota bacterium]
MSYIGVGALSFRNFSRHLILAGTLLAFTAPASAQLLFWVRGVDDVVMASGVPPSAASGTLYPNLPVRSAPITRTFQVVYNPRISTITVSQVTGPYFSMSTNIVDGGGSYITLNVNVSYDPRSEGDHAGQINVADWHDTFVMNLAGSSPGVLLTNKSPVNAARAVAPGANLSAWFTDGISIPSISNRFKAWGRQSGLHSGGVSTNGKSATLNPSTDFRPGESVFATLAPGIQNAAGEASVTSACAWSFQTAVSNVSIAFLGDSGRRLSTNDARAVGLGDVNRDGWLDLFVANYTGGCEVWTNNRAGMLYDSGQRLQTSRNATDVALGDLDNDGDLDALLVNWQANSRVFMNNGSGVFSSGNTLNNTNSGRAATLADFDMDGDLDAVIVNDSQTNRLWRNNGSGSFTAVPNSLGLARGCDAAAGDINGDGTLDVIIVYSNQNSVVWTNNGSGTFSSNGTLVAGTSMALGDVDGDNDLDVALGRTLSMARLYRNGGGSFSTLTNIPGDGKIVQLGDLDGDGDLDLVQLCRDNPSSVWLNNGAGTFIEVTVQTLGALPTAEGLDLGDLDNDGDLDAVVALGTNGVRMFWNSRPSMQVYGTNGTLLVNDDAPSVEKGTDFGILTGGSVTNTFVIANASPVNLQVPSIWTNGTMASQFRLLDTPTVLAAWSSFVFRIVFEPTGAGVQSAELGFDGSWTGTPFRINLQGTYSAPLFVTNTTPHNGSNPVTRASTVSAQFSEAVDPSTVNTNSFKLWSRTRGPLAGAVTVDGSNLSATFTPAAAFGAGETIFAEVTDSVLSSNGLSRLYPEVWSFIAEATNGTGLFYVRMLDAAAPSEYPSDAVLGDLDGDGDLDGMVSFDYVALTQSVVQVFLNDGAGGMTMSHDLMFPHLYTESGSCGMAPGDLDGDGDLDMVLGFRDTAYSPCALLWNDGHGGFAIDTNSIAAEGGFPSVGDLDGDGDLDLFLKDPDSYYGNGVAPWFNDGSGHFTRGVRIQGIYDQSSSRLADIDGDGDLDALVGDGDNVGAVYAHVTVLLNNGHGAFTLGQVLNLGFLSCNIEPGDVDGDGDFDLVVRDVVSSCWLNDGAGHFTKSSTFPAFENAYQQGALSMGDFDADRDLDALLSTEQTAAPYIMRNDGYGTFATGVIVCKSTGMYCVATGDLDGNGSLDAFCASGDRRNHHVLLNLSPNPQIPVIDLALSLTMDNGTTNMGDPIQFTLRLTNSGPDDATGVIVQNFCKPTNALRYLSCSGGPFNTTNGLWSTANLVAGAATSVQFTALVTFTGNLQQVAQVYAANEYDIDSTPSNYPVVEDDMTNLSFAIREAADVELTMSVDNTHPLVGSNVTFTISIRSLGPRYSAYAITNEFVLPVGLAFVSQDKSGSEGTYNTADGKWRIANQWITDSPDVMKITACVTNQGVFTPVARVFSTYFHDPYRANNTSIVTISTWPVIWASAGAHGTISPSGAVYVATGSNASFLVAADSYCWIDRLLTNGAEDAAARHAKIYTSGWNNVIVDGTISVSFADAFASHGTPEAWLGQYGWTNAFDAAEANDADGDRMAAWEEYVAGTDPTNAASFFQVSGFRSQVSGFVLRWNGVSGRLYSIDGNTNSLITGHWSLITNNLPPNGVWTDATHGADGMIHYRLGVQKP